jgi:acyl-CoA thioester hydrolase
MSDATGAAPVAAPLTLLRAPVDPAWIDRNDHVGIRGYADALSRASGHMLRRIRLNFDEAHDDGRTVYTLRWHMAFAREVRIGANLRFTAQLLDFSDRVIHYVVSMHNDDEDYLAASAEFLEAHVLLATRRTAPLPADRLALVEAIWATHKDAPWPKGAGEGIAVRGGRRERG